MKGAVAVMALLLSACVPWTVRPIGSVEQDTGSTAPFDAARFVQSIWTSRVVPAAQAAPGLAELRRANPQHLPAAFLIHDTGRVLKTDTASRTGFLEIDLAPFDGHADALIQIGPVIRGTALRDSLPFIQFSQFVNQLDFARAANALNDRAAGAALASLDRRHLDGSVVAFSGAGTSNSAGLPEIVPVELSIAEERK